MVRTIRFQSLPLAGPCRPGLAHSREHRGTVPNAEELLDEETRWKLQKLREAKRAALKKKQESLTSPPQVGPPGKPSPLKVAAKVVGSKPVAVQVVKQYSRPKVLGERWQVQGGLLEPCPPLFVQQIKPQETVEGQRCAFSCLFHGRPQPTVTWYNNDKPVGRIQGTAVHTTGCCSTLTFPSVLPQHGGTVTCVIFNPLGTVSTSAGLHVRQRMPAYKYAKKEKKEMKVKEMKVEEKKEEEKVKEEEREKEKKEEEKVKKEKEEEIGLVFSAEKGLPSAVPDSDLLSLPVEIKITAPTPTPEQDTEMRETPRLSPEQAASTIKHKFKFSFDMGNEPPQIVTEAPAHIHCHEGEEVVLECAVSGQPPPVVSWSLNGQSLSAGERLRFEEGKNGMYRLHLQEVSAADAGRYCCEATNVAGTAQTASELTVQPREAKLYSKDRGTEELPAMDHVLHIQGHSILGKNEEEQTACPKEEEAHRPWSLRLSPPPGEQLEDCEETPHIKESEMEETMVLDITGVHARQEMGNTEERVSYTGYISEMRQHKGKAVSEEHSFRIDTTELHHTISREGCELVAKDSGHFSEELEPEGGKVLPHTDTLSWDILKSPFMEVQGQTHVPEQSALAGEYKDLSFMEMQGQTHAPEQSALAGECKDLSFMEVQGQIHTPEQSALAEKLKDLSFMEVQEQTHAPEQSALAREGKDLSFMEVQEQTHTPEQSALAREGEDLSFMEVQEQTHTPEHALAREFKDSLFMEEQGQAHAPEQSAFTRECKVSEFFIPISPVVQDGSDVCTECDGPAWEAVTPDVPLVEEPSVPHLQDHIVNSPTMEEFGSYEFYAEEQPEKQVKEQERSVNIEQDIKADDNLCKEVIDDGDATHWKIQSDKQTLQEMESNAYSPSLDLIPTPSDTENSSHIFTEEAEVHLEEGHLREQLLPSEPDTEITFDLKKFAELFPTAETVYAEQAQIPTALESVEAITGIISPVCQCNELEEKMSLSEELRQSYRMQQEEVDAQEEEQPREITTADLQTANGDLGSVMISAEEGHSAEEVQESKVSVCGENSLQDKINEFLVEPTPDFQRGVQETHVWESGERLESTDFQSDSFIMDLKKAAQEEKPQAGHQAEEDGGSGAEKIFEPGMSSFTCEMESTDSPQEMLRDIQQEPNTNKGFSFGKLILGLVMDDPMAQKKQRKESWDKKRTPTEEASENGLDGEEMWEDTSAGPEPSAVQISEQEPDLSLANYLRSTGIYETPAPKGTVQKEQQETITSLEVEEVTFSMVYDYYNNHQELARPFSPESEMSIELESGSREESPDSDRFYTPPSSVEIFETASSASYHTPLSTPERYSTPSEGSGYGTPPERYSTPSEGSGYGTPPECYSTPSEGSVYSMAPEHYYTPSESSKCNTPSELYFTPFEGPRCASGDSTPPERYRTPTGEYMDALTMLPLCERWHQPPDQPQANEFMTPCEALEPSGRDMPPAFLRALSRRRLYEGSTLTFVAEVVGVPKPGVKWYHNKSLLELDERVQIEKDGDKYVLEITNVQKADEGQYLCHAVNIVGEAKSIAEVEVLPEDGRSLALPPPVMHQHVIHFDMEQNTSSRSPSPQEILLEVELDENEVKEFEKQVKIITSPEFSPDKKSMVVSLDVLPLALLEQAAGLAAGENEDIKIDFQVTEMPPRFAVPFTDIKVTEGLDAIFECVVTGTPVPVVQWFRGDTCVTPGTGKYVVSQKEGLHSLKVQTVEPSDSGLYHCQATNRLGEATCRGSLVVMAQQEANAVSSETVTGSETHRSQKRDLLLSTTVSPGDQSEIELEFEFEPQRDDSEKAIQLLAVTQQEQEVEGEKHVNISFDVFAEPSEEERVEFRAEDSESCSFEFQVTEAPPRFVRLISDYSTFVGASACFQCLVTGSPHPSIHWYKDGVLLEGDRYCAQEEQNGLHSLTIENLMQSDSGQYKCVATNRAGTAETCAVLTLY